MKRYTGISLLSEKLKVIIVGGGRAAFIKAKIFCNNGCKICVLSKSFIEEFKLLKGDINFIKGEYDKRHILDKHLVVIAIDDDKVCKNIIRDCDECLKLYLTCKNFKEGMFVMPVQVETENINAFINIKGASPKTSLFIADKIESLIKGYNDFAGYVVSIREKYKDEPYKDLLMEFINSDYFFECYKKNTHENVLKEFIGGFKIEP